MSGWDTSSRPTWDPEDGPGDTTQAFSAQDHSENDQPGQRPPRHGSNGLSYEPGRAGPPPDIFQQGYDRDRNGQGSYRSPGAAEQDHARRDYEATDFESGDFGSKDFPGSDYTRRSASSDYTSREFRDRELRDSDARDRASRDYASADRDRDARQGP